MEELDLPEFLIVDQTSHPLSSALCGFSRPERLGAFLVDGLSVDTSDGAFDPARFSVGRPQGVFAVLAEDEGNRAYTALVSYFRGRRARTDLAAEDCEAAVASWRLPEGRVALLILDANDSGRQPMQETWEEVSRIMRFGAYDANLVLASDRFDPVALIENKAGPSSLLDALQVVCQPSPPTPVRTRRSP